MKVRLWQLRLSLAAGALASGAAAPPPAQTSDRATLTLLCTDPELGKPVDVQVAACDAVIGSPLTKRADLAAAYQIRGEELSRKGQYSLAIAAFNQAIRLAPKMATAYSRRGDAYASLGDDDANQDLARADYEHAARLDPARFGAGDPDVIAEQSKVSHADQPSAATAAIGAAIAQSDQARAEVVKLDAEAQALYQQARFADAEPLFRRAMVLADAVLGERDPATLAILNNLAATLGALGRAGEAEPLIRKSYGLSTDVLGARHPSTLQSLNNLGGNLIDQGRYEEAEPLLRAALKLRTEVLGERDPQVLDSMNALSVNLMDQGRLAEAEALLRKTVQLQADVLGEEHFDTRASMGNLAVVLIDEDRPAEAEPLIRKLLQGLSQSSGERTPMFLGYLQNLAVSLSQQDRFGDAEPLFRKALQLQSEQFGERHLDTLRTRGNLAGALFGQGKAGEAYPLWQKTLQLQLEVLGERHRETLGTAYSMALSGDLLGKGATVEPMLEKALGLQREVLGPQHPETLASAVLLAEVRLKMAPTADALGPARMAVAGWRARQQIQEGSAGIEAGLAREALQNQSVYLVLAEAAWRATLATPAEHSRLQAEAYLALQGSTAAAASQALAQAAARNAAEGGGVGLGALARERQQQSERWRENNVAQTKALARPNDPASAMLRKRLNAEESAIEAEISRIDTRLRADFPDYFALVRPTPLEVHATQQLLKPDEAIVLVVPSPYGTQIIVVTRDTMDWQRSRWGSEEIKAAVRRLLWDVGADVGVDNATALLWQSQGGKGYSYDRKTAYNLYQQIIAPVARSLEGKSHLFIATGGVLTSLPFGILVTDPPQGANGDPQALRGTKWFADAHALTVIPSIQSLQFLRRAAPRNGTSDTAVNFVGYGDPVLEGTAQTRGPRSGPGISARALFKSGTVRSAGALVDLVQLNSLAQLPGTAVELEAMRAAMGAPTTSVHTRSEATESAFKSADLSKVGVLAIATHGLMAGELTGSTEPGLVFTPPSQASEQDDGFLTTSEVAQLRLDADWVILSACNTASGDGSEGAPGLSGLARAFFYAGARNLLVSHWPVRDDVASRLTVETIRLQKADPALSRSQALQLAMRGIRNDASHDSATDTWAHPNAWAPFSLIGDGAH